jgi:hypothetical protein
MLEFIIIFAILYFTRLLPFVFMVIVFILELLFTAFIIVMGFVIFMIGYPISLFKSK